MPVDFSCLTPAHVKRACKRAIKDGVPSKRSARSTFILFEGHKLPVKYILGLAYKLATGRGLGYGEYTGGKSSAKILEGLGFRTEHCVSSGQSEGGGEVLAKSREPLRRSKNRKPFVSNKSQVGKEGLLRRLRERFGEVEVEKGFSWLRVPNRSSLSAEIRAVFHAIYKSRSIDNFDTPGRKLRCDFFIPTLDLVIEVDERQHFTAQRAVALRAYPSEVEMGFDIAKWIKKCEMTGAKDSSPPHRDEQRAYYDTLRDLLSARSGIRIIRIAEDQLLSADGVKSALEKIAGHFDKTSDSSASTSSLTVATACVLGRTAKTPQENNRRARLLRCVAEGISHHGWKPDILLFPGGYFRIGKHIGHLSDESRMNYVAGRGLSKTCCDVAKSLGALLVAGIDGVPRKRRGSSSEPDGGDQLCVAWSAQSVIGVGRKIFPTSNENEKLVSFLSDFSSAHRLVSWHDSFSALLLSCYDMFGCSEKPERQGGRSRNILRLDDGNNLLLRTGSNQREFRQAILRGLRDWKPLVQSADVGLAAIHGFSRTGKKSGKGYWQRYGIEKASMQLGGGRAFGACHFFDPPLPKPEVAVLAGRKGNRLAPCDTFYTGLENNEEVLVRLYR